MKMNFNLPPMNFSSMGSVSQFAKQVSSEQNAKKQTEAPIQSPYANHPRNITNKDWRKIVPVSDDIKQQITAGVRESFANYGGMETEKFNLRDIKNAYISLQPSDQQSYVSWTLDQLQVEEANRIRDFVNSKDPTWDFGKPVKPEILEEAFKAPQKLDVKI